jgi:TetR/AcrR family transcriptional regulator, transcriptional repressor for nem operon
MPRPREFHEASALKAALECFWRRGYEATSLRDLTGAMGLTAPSIYNAFGDKQELFGRALDQYLEHTTRERLRRLHEELAPKEAIRRFFAEIVDHSINDRQRKGCFLVNSALEVARTMQKSVRSLLLSLGISKRSSGNAFLLAKRIEQFHPISRPMR